MLKDSLTDFFKVNFGKAVKFEDVRLSIFGDIKVSGLNVSISSDFNDNISLIQSPSVTIGLDLSALMRGKARINGVRFDEPNITLIKRYDQGYEDTLLGLFMSGRPLDEVDNIDLKDFTLRLSDGRFTFVEHLIDGKISLEGKRLGFEARFQGDEIKYGLSGTLLPLGSREIRKGGFLATGTLYRIGVPSRYSSRHHLSIENFDLSYLNQKLVVPPYSVFGGMSVGIDVRVMSGHVSVDGAAALNNLNLVEKAREGARNIIANENMNMEFTADVLDEGNRIVVRNMEVGDDATRIKAKAIYSKNAREEYFDAHLEHCRVDLTKLSDYLAPWEKLSFDGRFEGAGRLLYDMRHNRALDLHIIMSLADFKVKGRPGGPQGAGLLVPLAKFTANDGVVSISAAFRKGESDLDLRGNAYVSHWFPLISESTLMFESKVMEALYPAGLAFERIRRLYRDAIEDRAGGYEQIFFMKTPLGSFMNNNRVDCELKAGNILFGGRKALSDLSAAARLADGFLRLESFSLDGMGADYGLDMRAYLKSDYPSGSITARISGLDLYRLGQSLGIAGSMSGTLGADLSFEFNGNRKAHLIDNGKMEANMTVESGVLSETSFQKRLSEFLVSEGYEAPALGRVGFTRATVSAKQSGPSLYLGNLYFSGDSINASGYGAYRCDDGLNIPLSASFLGEGTDELPGKITSLSLSITGSLFEPVLKVAGRKDSSSLSLFHVD